MTARPRKNKQMALPAGWYEDGTGRATLKQVLDPKFQTVDFSQMTRRQQAEVTAIRIRERSHFKMAVLGEDVIDQDRAIREVEDITPIGIALMGIERRMIRILIEKYGREMEVSARSETDPTRERDRRELEDGGSSETDVTKVTNQRESEGDDSSETDPTTDGTARREFWLFIKALRIDSNDDDSTKAACTYRDQNLREYLMRRFTVIPLIGVKATQSNAAEESVDFYVRFITGVGHGFPNCFTGNGQGKVFLKDDYDEKEVNGKTVHFFACHTAKELGPDFLSKGCRAFFGYDDYVFFPLTDEAGDQDSNEQELDALFQCDTEIDKQLANRKHPAIVFEEVLAMFDKKISELSVCPTDEDESNVYHAAVLEQARMHLRLLLADPKSIPDS